MGFGKSLYLKQVIAFCCTIITYLSEFRIGIVTAIILFNIAVLLM